MGTSTGHHAFLSHQVVALISPVIHLPFGTLGDIFIPVTVQVAVRNHF